MHLPTMLYNQWAFEMTWSFMQVQNSLKLPSQISRHTQNPCNSQYAYSISSIITHQANGNSGGLRVGLREAMYQKPP